MATRKKKNAPGELPSQPDPCAPLDGDTLLAAAAPVLRRLSEDLQARASASPAVSDALKQRHEAEKRAQRTAEAFAGWRDNFCEQLAAAWLLSCVFVRTLEDRGLIERRRLAGPGAIDSERAFFALAPSLTPRDYLWTVFRELSHLPAAAELFDLRHNPVWLLGPSGEVARELLALFRLPNADNPAFRFGGPDSRFLGDLYERLSESVRERYALLQTPAFVERFILDRTLTPALKSFGLAETTLIDPTCGSGHFLLGAFERLLEARMRAEPGVDTRPAALEALDAIAGADINPYAVAIAKFRLTLAFLEKAGYTRLKDAPQLPLNVVVADSLLHNPQSGQQNFGDLAGQAIAPWKGSDFQLEDEDGARRVLYRTYAAVVGNPPYKNVDDPALRERYRAMYSTAIREYSLCVPFGERFFQLARPAGRIGMIVANSFMKREFGKKFVEEFLSTVNLDLIVNAAGAYIPGHGTPTVLLFGSADPATKEDVLSVLPKRGEPSTPMPPEEGRVWQSILEGWNKPGYENEFISVEPVDRPWLDRHPWVLSGGGAIDLVKQVEASSTARLAKVVDAIGFSVITGEDNVLCNERAAFCRAGVPIAQTRRLVLGEEVRDWAIATGGYCAWPRNDLLARCAETDLVALLRYLWPCRTILRARKAFSVPVEKKGIPWWDLREVYTERMRTPLTITFAFVSTHNHFVLDRGGKVFKQSAPIIKLPETATEEDHYALLAYLNSSTACFWMKQVMMNKGGSGIGRGIQDESWEARFEFDGTKVSQIPLPTALETLAPLAKQMVKLRNELDAAVTDHCLHGGSPAPVHERFAEMVALQETIDWRVYQLFGLVDEAAVLPTFLPVGSRPFERLLNEQPTAWFERNGYDRPKASDNQTQTLIQVDRIRQSKFLGLLETPEYKRRWTVPDLHDALAQAKRHQELTALEEFVAPASSVTSLGDGKHIAGDAAVPYLATLRFTDSGVKKHSEWERTWDLQRREDAGETVGEIPVPRKYASTDFREAQYWSLRGKLDVPSERFISYPGCESDEDGKPLHGWAGWDHYQRAKALAELYYQRKSVDGWEKERLQPMLAGLLELLPWLKQWHSDPLAELGGDSPAAQFTQLLEAECAEHGFSHDDLRAWRPAPAQRRAKKRATTPKPTKKTRAKKADVAASATASLPPEEQ
jgi:hypothetical protein